MPVSMSGMVRRRILVNYRAPAEALQPWLPPGMRPKLHQGDAIVGVCLIRLERLRPSLVPVPLGVSAEYAAHRVAVEWEGADGRAQEGVYIPRRDSAAWMHRVGLPILSPVALHPADFKIQDDGDRVRIEVESRDGVVAVRFAGRRAPALPSSSRFASLDEASRFFADGDRGYSPRKGRAGLDGVALQTDGWRVEPLAAEEAYTSYLEDGARLPRGVARFDCALVMRDLAHRWVGAAAPGGAAQGRPEA
jgi:hypothetical protein